MKEQILDFLEKSAFLREHVVKRLASDRSPEWSKVRNDHIKKNPNCAVCLCNKQVQVHHKLPFHLNPLLELDRNNLITLCAKDHLLFGHLGNWKSFNPTVKEDCDEWRQKCLNRPKS